MSAVGALWRWVRPRLKICLFVGVVTPFLAIGLFAWKSDVSVLVAIIRQDLWRNVIGYPFLIVFCVLGWEAAETFGKWIRFKFSGSRTPTKLEQVASLVVSGIDAAVDRQAGAPSSEASTTQDTHPSAGRTRDSGNTVTGHHRIETAVWWASGNQSHPNGEQRSPLDPSCEAVHTGCRGASLTSPRNPWRKHTYARPVHQIVCGSRHPHRNVGYRGLRLDE